ncbi:GNAT family N-acetyltransferase [Alkalibacillus haloalkaliphilus]|uniref:GNAT family N-acetyltransferase n=1 Tax=Alkalibacillus haloalkaliphilus TaxID=94136 RepID=UPI0029364FC8|nr:GNAT family N-acetyltransferase [Alkalibacillus haloalkaliphilus]MDV2582359.1 GNAT family N-acetyltransferase [Alkalibacillus haloalkaliphilus]
MEIRILNAQDAEAYRRLRFDALQVNPEAFASSFEEEKDRTVEVFAERLESEQTVSLGSFLGDALVGMATLQFEKYYKMRHRGNLSAMYVTSSARGYGYGNRLLEHGLMIAKNHQLEQVYLTVVSSNVQAKNLYENIGFETIGLEENAIKLDDGLYHDEEHMVKFL